MLDYLKIISKIPDINNLKEITYNGSLLMGCEIAFSCEFSYADREFLFYIPKNFPLDMGFFYDKSNQLHSHVAAEDGYVCLFNQEDISYDISNPVRVIYALFNALKDLYSFDEERETSEIEMEYNDYLDYFYNYVANNIYFMADKVDKGLKLFEFDEFILIGNNERMLKDYLKKHKASAVACFPLELESLPKINREVLTPEKVYECLTYESKKLLKRYKRKSYKHYYLLNHKLSNGTVNRLLLEINHKRKIESTFNDSNSNMIIHAVRDISSSFLRFRGGSDSIDANVLVIGCGSVGSEAVDLLASSGFKNISLVDKELLSFENTYRNVTGFRYLKDFKRWSKTSVLKHYIEEKYPDTVVKYLNMDIKEALSKNKLGFASYDYIVVCTGNDTLYQAINKYMYDNEINTKLIFAWLEPFGVAEHILTIDTSKSGCYNCLINSSRNIRLTEDNVDYKIKNNVCAGSFTPYGRLSTISLASRITKILLDDARGTKEIENRQLVKKGDFTKYLSYGYKLTDYAKMSNEELDELSKDFIYEGCDVCGKHNN